VRVIIEPPPEPGEPLAPLWKRLGWFFGLAISAALATALVAYGLRALLR
jgi:hypothetical protein